MNEISKDQNLPHIVSMMDLSSPDLKWKPIAGAGSDRQYSRLSSLFSEDSPCTTDSEDPSGVKSSVGASVVRAKSEDVVENRAFINLARIFRKYGVNVPLIYSVSEDEKTYYLEDLGERDLLSYKGSEDFERYAMNSLIRLVKLQTIPEREWGGFVQHPSFSKRQVLFDLNYFKYCLLKPAGVAFDEERLEDDFERFASDLVSIPEEMMGFMYRDFQSRNIMIRNDEPWFIDFQGGRKGPVLYDAVSLLWQAKADLTDEMRTALLKVYADEYERQTGVPASILLRPLSAFVLFRTLQVLGAYGMRGLTQRRAHFLQSLSSGLSNLRKLLDDDTLLEYPELKKACDNLCKIERFSDTEVPEGKLRIKVFSFSYKKGYPDDFSGNGGGFMFDCRPIHNPGRYEEYKSLTGRDEPVIRFLEEKGEVQKFLESAWSLIDPSVERYLSRGFSSLQVGFGCTGGQHRSVYCAEHTAKHLHSKFPDAVIELIHREQKIREIFNVI